MRRIFTFLWLLLRASVFGQIHKEDVNLTDFIREIEQWKKENNRIQFVAWMPADYWEIAGSQSSNVPPKTINQMKEAMKDLVLVYVLDMRSNGDGTMEFKSNDEIKNDLALLDSGSLKYYPLAEKNISQRALRIGDQLRPFFAQNMGKMGQGLNIFYFQVKDNKGQNLINPRLKNSFSIREGGKQFSWVLPLVSLMPPKFCPVDKEKMKGNWNYCPIHGVKLN
jgi:hypothetical protein